MLQALFSNVKNRIEGLISRHHEDSPDEIRNGDGTKGAEYAALSAVTAPLDSSGFGYKRNLGLMQKAWDLITITHRDKIEERIQLARKALEYLDRFATTGKATFSNGQEFVLGVTYGSNTGGIPRQIVAERQNRFKDRLRKMCRSMPSGYRPGKFEAQSNPTYQNSGKVAPAEMHMFTTIVPEVTQSEPRVEPTIEYSKNNFIKRHQMQFESLNEKIVQLPNGQGSIFVGWALDPEVLNRNGSQALCDVLQKYVNKAIELGYEIAGPIGFPHIEEIRNPRNPNDRAIEFVMHVALMRKDGGSGVATIDPGSLKEIIPKISEEEKDQLKAQEGVHHDWEGETDRNCYTLGTVKVAGKNVNKIGFSANLVCGYDSFEGDVLPDTHYRDLSDDALKRAVTDDFFNPSARLDISQLFYNLGIRMQRTAWQLNLRGGSDARRGPTHYVVVKAPYADEHTEEYLKKHKPGTGLTKPQMYMLFELSAWRNVSNGVNEYRNRVEFEPLQLPHDYFRRAHEIRRGLMKGWDMVKQQACAAWTTLGESYFYLEHMAGSSYKRKDGKIPPWGKKSGFRYSEYLSVQLKDAVNIFNTYPEAQIDEFRPSDVVVAGNFDPGSPGGHGVPTNIDRLNLRIHATNNAIKSGKSQAPDTVDFIKFKGFRAKEDASLVVEDASGCQIEIRSEDDLLQQGKDSYHRLRRAFEHGLTFWKNKRFFVCQVYQDAKLYLYEAKLKFFNLLSLGGCEGVYFSAAEHNCPSQYDQLFLDPTIMIGIDDDTFGQQGRDCHTGVLLSFNEIKELFSGKYRALGYPEAELFTLDTDQNWGFIHGEFGGMIFDGLLDSADEIAFSTLARMGLRIKDRSFSRADWEGRVKEVIVWIHDEDSYHLIERAMYNRLNPN